MARFIILLLTASLADALITSDVSRSRLFEAFSSPSGKLTFSPELVIPESTDPTAILLQTNAVQTLSQNIRSCKANAAFIQGSIASLGTFATEQEGARGNFPGPVPVVFCPSEEEEVDFSELSEIGVEGVMIQVCNGDSLSSLDEIDGDDSFTKRCKAAFDVGLQPIPEVIIKDDVAASFKENDIEELVEKVTAKVGEDPVSIVISVSGTSEADDESPVALPAVPKALGKKVPILGSVSVLAGDGRIGAETARFKQCGFTGAFLRNDCLPGFRGPVDLGIVGMFWNNAINDLKSTKSKSFSFRSKNNMEKSQATVWGNFQKDVVESGALGDPNEMVSINSDAGDYQGFA